MGTQHLTGTRVFALTAALLMSVGGAGANTIVDIQPGGWTAALRTGNITPSTGSSRFTWAAEQFYAGDNPIAAAATLTPDISVSDGTTTELALAMSWDLPQGTPEPLAVAWWDYAFRAGGRPSVNLSTGSSLICFSLLPPPGVWDFSVELIDVNGNSRGWFRANPPTGSWGQFCFSPNLGLQNPFGDYFSQPDFDITQVAFIRFDEAGMWSAPFPVPPQGIPGPAWNAWDSLRIVTPEPAILLLISVGLFGITFTTGRRNNSC